MRKHESVMNNISFLVSLVMIMNCKNKLLAKKRARYYFYLYMPYIFNKKWFYVKKKKIIKCKIKYRIK